jgi:predicted deacylase
MRNRLDTAAPSSRIREEICVAVLADGSRLDVPLIVITGAERRPRLVCVAGIHGDEPEGMRALMELADELDPAALRGQLVLVPVANPSAFGAGLRMSPIDGLDLNRIFPGSSQGSISERLAHMLFNEVLLGADFVFALHSWYATGEVMPYVEYGHTIAATARASLGAAHAAGFELIRASHWPQGLMTRCVNEAGIPAIESEIGGLGVITADGTSITKLCIRSLMVHLGMLEGAVAPSQGRIVDQFELATPCGGFLDIAVPLGVELDAGDTLGLIRALDGAVRDRIVMPRRGLLGAVRRAPRVQPGERIARLFIPYQGVEAR